MLFGQNQVVNALQSLFAIRQIVLYSWLCIETALYAIFLLYAKLFCTFTSRVRIQNILS